MSSIQLNPLSSSSSHAFTDSGAESSQASSKHSSSDLGSRHQVSSLPIMHTDQQSDITLWEHFVANKDVLWLLKVTCNYWPKSDGCACDCNLFHKFCFVVAWLAIMASAMVALYYLIASLVFGHGEHHRGKSNDAAVLFICTTIAIFQPSAVAATVHDTRLPGPRLVRVHYHTLRGHFGLYSGVIAHIVLLQRSDKAVFHRNWR